MIEQNAVAAEQEAKSSRNDADLAGKRSVILDLVFCMDGKEKKKRVHNPPVSVGY